MSSKHNKFLDRAFEIAMKVDPHATSPNPRVGCVIVREGKIIAEGAHQKRGEVHAEVDAMKKIPGGDISGCEVYITLEPCDSFAGKKTKSCTQLLIKSKPKAVIVGTKDVRFNGENLKKLEAVGIRTEVCDYDAEQEKLNPFYEKVVRTGYPYVTLKVAQSLNGQIINPAGSWVSNDASRQQVHQMRATYSAILTTTETVLRDNPKMNARNVEIPWEVSDPKVLIVGSEERLSGREMVFGVPHREVRLMSKRPFDQVLLHASSQLGIDSIITECGQRVNTRLLAGGWVDEIQVFIAPKFYSRTKNIFSNEIDLKGYSLAKAEDVKGDVWLRYLKRGN